MTTRPLRLACLISGGGRTLLNLADRIDAGDLPATIELVIASRAAAPGVERARQRGFEPMIAHPKRFDSVDAMHDALTGAIVQHDIDLICLCGYLRWLRIDEPMRGRTINIHPSLLPRFGGQGMHGDYVHAAVLESGASFSGCTVHFVDDEYDRGPIIMQRACPVLPDDTVETLAARVFAEECVAYPEAVRLFAEDRVRLVEDRAVITAAVGGSSRAAGAAAHAAIDPPGG